jgi:hypothetical protein
MKIEFIVIVSCSILMAACHKKSSTDTEPRKYIDTRITGDEFKPGSYWIYSNDSTRKTDCTYVFKVENGFIEQPYDLSGKKAFYEYYDIFYHDKDSLNMNYYDRFRLDQSYIFRLQKNYDSIHNGGILLYYYPVAGELIRVDFDSIEHIDSLRVGNYSFTNVQKAVIDSNFDCFYTSVSTGVVRKVIRHSSHQGTWNLLRWKIN